VGTAAGELLLWVQHVDLKSTLVTINRFLITMFKEVVTSQSSLSPRTLLFRDFPSFLVVSSVTLNIAQNAPHLSIRKCLLLPVFLHLRKAILSFLSRLSLPSPQIQTLHRFPSEFYFRKQLVGGHEHPTLLVLLGQLFLEEVLHREIHPKVELHLLLHRVGLVSEVVDEPLHVDH